MRARRAPGGEPARRHHALRNLIHLNVMTYDRSLFFFALALSSASALVTGCKSAQGGEGQTCIASGCSGILCTGYTCDDGLVCNQNAPGRVCQEPSSVPVGGGCSDSVDCVTGSYCFESACTAGLAAGSSCDPAANQCSSGLACLDVGSISPTCGFSSSTAKAVCAPSNCALAEDAGTVASPDASSDAAPEDGGK